VKRAGTRTGKVLSVRGWGKKAVNASIYKRKNYDDLKYGKKRNTDI